VKLGIKLKLHSPAPRAIPPDLAEGRTLGVTSYPALLLQGHGRLTAADLSHDPELAVSRIKELLN